MRIEAIKDKYVPPQTTPVSFSQWGVLCTSGIPNNVGTEEMDPVDWSLL